MDPAATFAPLVRLHGDEELLPMSAAAFVGQSSLTWGNDPCVIQQTLAIGAARLRLGRDEPAPSIVPTRLGGRPRPYRARPLTPDCRRLERRSYATTQPARPYGRGARAAGLRPGEGFFLDLLAAAHEGGPASEPAADRPGEVLRAPAYYSARPTRVEGEPGLRVAYWLLFGYQSPRPDAAADGLAHEGDWERFEVLARRAGGDPLRYVPVAVRLGRGGAARELRWGALEVAGGAHPVVYAALGSHSLYPSSGVRRQRARGLDGVPVAVEDRTAACSDCVEWRTWRRLRPLRREPWLGYRGGWGTSYLGSARSGPVGP